MTPRAALAVFSITSSILVLPHSESRELDTLKDVTERWIQTRNRISEEQASWATEKELLQGSINTLGSTKEILEENVKILELQTNDLQEEIDAANQRIESFEQSNTFILSKVESYERRILKLTERLPEPLKEEIAPLIRKIPDEGGSAPPLPNRLQNVVAISTLIDEFNNDLTLNHTIKPLDDGSVIEVRVLYWGLAGAYASNADGSKAWIVKPASGEWKWIEETQNPIAIKQLFDVYDKTIDPQLVEVPYSFLNAGGEG
ncbi:DUF3450 family protein [Pelagicoccus mobilis]|uniref:DUF3450 family protein n=1 Tax=Pelagicoccus mobilis TaxID=415221 RepID=A0A934RSQ0_9BACT|nr:DUF3450 family protein [Pelagicoccus mobilis]MBK1875728.1 DUF3450 family protein [Pelagicoccus mobilis]